VKLLRPVKPRTFASFPLKAVIKKSVSDKTNTRENLPILKNVPGIAEVPQKIPNPLHLRCGLLGETREDLPPLF
jgi:hypothetical protein